MLCCMEGYMARFCREIEIVWYCNPVKGTDSIFGCRYMTSSLVNCDEAGEKRDQVRENEREEGGTSRLYKHTTQLIVHKTPN